MAREAVTYQRLDGQNGNLFRRVLNHRSPRLNCQQHGFRLEVFLPLLAFLWAQLSPNIFYEDTDHTGIADIPKKLI